MQANAALSAACRQTVLSTQHGGMGMRKRTSLLVLIGFTLTLSSAGCGSSDDTSGDNDVDDVNPPVAKNTTNPTSKRKENKPDLFPRVIIRTSLGDITVKLNAEKAPLTVENFLAYVESGHYDGTIYHYVEPEYVVMGGIYTPELKEKKGERSVFNEAHNGLSNVRGTIAMARESNRIDSSFCQFFFNMADNIADMDPKPHENPYKHPEDYGYCVFGEVVEGMDVLDKISKVESSDKGEDFIFLPKRTVLIKSARRLR